MRLPFVVPLTALTTPELALAEILGVVERSREEGLEACDGIADEDLLVLEPEAAGLEGRKVVQDGVGFLQRPSSGWLVVESLRQSASSSQKATVILLPWTAITLPLPHSGFEG